jgi:hypothetical protein
MAGVLSSLSSGVKLVGKAIGNSPTINRFFGGSNSGEEGQQNSEDLTMDGHPVNVTVNGGTVGSIVANQYTVNTSSSGGTSNGDDDQDDGDKECVVSRKNNKPIIPAGLMKLKKNLITADHAKKWIPYYPYLCPDQKKRRSLLEKVHREEEIDWNNTHYDDFAQALKRLKDDFEKLGKIAFESFVAKNFATGGFKLDVGQPPVSFADVKTIVSSPAMKKMFREDPLLVLQIFFTYVMGCTTETSDFTTRILPSNLRSAAANHPETPFLFYTSKDGRRHPLVKVAGEGVTTVKRSFCQCTKQALGISLTIRKDGRRDNKQYEVPIDLGTDANPRVVKTYVVFDKNGSIGKNFTETPTVEELLGCLGTSGGGKNGVDHEVNHMVNQMTKSGILAGLGPERMRQLMDESYLRLGESGLVGRAPKKSMGSGPSYQPQAGPPTGPGGSMVPAAAGGQWQGGAPAAAGGQWQGGAALEMWGAGPYMAQGFAPSQVNQDRALAGWGGPNMGQGMAQMSGVGGSGFGSPLAVRHGQVDPTTMMMALDKVGFHTPSGDTPGPQDVSPEKNPFTPSFFEKAAMDEDAGAVLQDTEVRRWSRLGGISPSNHPILTTTLSFANHYQ